MMPDTALSSLVSVHSRFARSVHLERDHRRSPGGNYYLTESARQLLQTVCASFDHAAERAISVVGPYGAGKSAFCVFAAGLLSGVPAAVNLLQEADPVLAERLRARALHLIPVLVVGSREPIGYALVEGILSALREGGHPQMSARLAQEGKALLQATPLTPRAVADFYLRAAELARSFDHSGILLIVDELGKFLEYAALHPRDGDVFFLQEMAEAAARSGDAPLLVLGILHQNAESYAQKLGRTQQVEWAKVGERFRAVNFFPSDSERIELVGRALQHSPHLQLNGQVTGVCTDYEALTLPGAASLRRFSDLARAAYPLHPLTLLALPALFRRSGQSHRSLFNFLAAEEPHALGAFLQQQVYSRESPPFYTLDMLFDYAAEVLAPGWHASGVMRLWADAVESVERAATLDPPLRKVLKAIALLNILKEPRLPASEEVLALALGSSGLTAKMVKDALDLLERRRLVVSSRARSTYRLWEGGDVDVEAELASARRLLPENVTLRVASQLCPPPRLIARRHSYETGTTRLVQTHPCYADQLRSTLNEAGRELSLILCLARTAQEELNASDVAGGCVSPNALICIANETEALTEAAADIAAADHVERSSDSLQHDRAARRELAARRTEAEQEFLSEWKRLFGPEPGVNKWWRLQENLAIESERDFSHLLSEIAKSTYYAAPHLRNELINRRSLSSAAAAGRRNLIEAMLDRGAEKDLGITQFPPELSMYRCVLQATGLHREIAPGEWAFVPPSDSGGEGSLRPVWVRLEQRLFGGPPEPVPLVDVYNLLGGPPYGLTEGVLPVVICAFLLAHRDETSLYREGTFRPEPTVADFEVLLRRPELFALAGCRVAGSRMAVVERLAHGLGTTPKTVPIVRALLRTVKSLPEYAFKTQRLPAEVLALREAAARTRSPERFLFQELPTALGAPLPEGEDANPAGVEAFFDTLNQTLTTWSTATEKLIDAARDQLLDSCSLPPGREGWVQLRTRAQLLHPATCPASLTAFIKRLQEAREPQQSIESILALIANRPPRSWTDADADRFADQARILGGQFQHACSLADTQDPIGRYPELEQETRQLTSSLRKHLPQTTNPIVLRAALLALLAEVSDAQGESDKR